MSVKFTPVGYAVDIQMDLNLGELAELLPAPDDLLFNFTPDPERPGLGIKWGNAAVMQDWKFHRKALSRR